MGGEVEHDETFIGGYRKGGQGGKGKTLLFCMLDRYAGEFEYRFNSRDLLPVN